MEEIAKQAAAVAAGIVGSFSPLGGVLLKWASSVAFEIYDLEKSGKSGVEAAQHAGDRVADLVESLKLGA
ncbi:MAG: hypothetical protein EBR82_12140 [Caulobacteraceae bacterium]|nr:hypothetical protein [Caulobacteraceae bacterium]